MGALVAAHELGHSFNSIHDGVPGVCASTPQTYLMAPTINYSNQFSSCSLSQINTLVASASCLKQVAAPTSSTSSDPSTGPSTSSGTTSSGSTSSGGGDTVSDPTTSGTNSTGGTNGSGSSSGGGGGGGGSLDLAWLAFLGGMLVWRSQRRPTQTPPTNP
jgi:hypothetical protein